ncbi:alpha/beta hydrolase-fold protein [Actinoallomurus purpureus]|uniref:alpha/beta hydrolase n=1 Tax=Actinoallomurus purpureus TaxID=478114 RepID=UPI0020935534|nr:alpha/beta hydrolase-fold protein [Actinoallomurus purpureus]MCO6006071.1 alpha/beta hydrolase-fold protein [Actinoallomurus purpureus]
MGLTSGGFFGFLILVAVVVTGVTIWWWAKFAGSGIGPFLARIGIFLTAQVTLIMVLLVGVNNYFLFYASWSDLMGTNHQAVNVQLNNNNASTATKPQGGGRPLARQMTTIGQKHKADPAKDGQIEQVQIRGDRTGLTTQAYVYLPPQYFQKKFNKRHFPVMYDFTGFPGVPEQLITRLGVPAIAAKEMNAGRVQPMVIVMMRPSPTSVMPRDTECTDVPGGPQVLTFYSQDVPERIMSTYRVAAGYRSWGVMGDSTGGYCAVKLAMERSDRFTAAVSMAGYFYPRQDWQTGDLYGGSKQVKMDNSLIWRLQHLPPPPVSVLVTTSKDGERDFGEARKFLQLATAPLTTDKIMVPGGGHNPHTWKRVTPSALQWMSAHLAHEGS